MVSSLHRVQSPPSADSPFLFGEPVLPYSSPWDQVMLPPCAARECIEPRTRQPPVNEKLLWDSYWNRKKRETLPVASAERNTVSQSCQTPPCRQQGEVASDCCHYLISSFVQSGNLFRFQLDTWLPMYRLHFLACIAL